MRTQTQFKGPLTYVGCTNNFTRRLRQHNGEIKGGAKCTTSASKQGCVWSPILFAKGFATKNEALSFEWHWKNESRRIKYESAVNKRRKALILLLSNPRFSHIYKDENSCFSEKNSS